MRMQMICPCRGIVSATLLFFAAGWVLCAVLPEEVAAHHGDRRQQAEQLVREALAHQSLGLNGQRDRLLAEAQSTDPDYPPAHWHQGRVKIGDAWSKVDNSSAPGRSAGAQPRDGTQPSESASLWRALGGSQRLLAGFAQPTAGTGFDRNLARPVAAHGGKPERQHTA
jgi:hypothetical protein